MINGFWPDQAAYNQIHNHELYKSASEAEDVIYLNPFLFSYSV